MGIYIFSGILGKRHQDYISVPCAKKTHLPQRKQGKTRLCTDPALSGNGPDGKDPRSRRGETVAKLRLRRTNEKPLGVATTQREPLNESRGMGQALTKTRKRT